MKKLFILLALLPAFACAQLNEVKTDKLLVGPSTGATVFLSVNRSSNLAMQQTGNFTGSGGSVVGFYQAPTLITGQGLNAFGTWLAPSITKAAAGVHPDIATLLLSAPNIAGGAATVTNAVTLNIGCPGAGATTKNLSIWVQSGQTQLDGNIIVTATGPHSIGGATDANAQLIQRGTFTPGTSNASGFAVISTLIALANNSAFGVYIAPTLNKAGAGTHTDFAGLFVDIPSVTAGAAALTNATSLKINGAPAVGTNQRALWVAAGTTSLDGTIVFPSIPSATGVRFLCVSTTGVVTSQAAACVGT